MPGAYLYEWQVLDREDRRRHRHIGESLTAAHEAIANKEPSDNTVLQSSLQSSSANTGAIAHTVAQLSSRTLAGQQHIFRLT